MKRVRFTEEQDIAALREHEAGAELIGIGRTPTGHRVALHDGSVRCPVAHTAPNYPGSCDNLRLLTALIPWRAA